MGRIVTKQDFVQALEKLDVGHKDVDRLEGMLGDLIDNEREDAVDKHECDHDDCVDRYEMEALETSTRALFDLLEDLGIDEREFELLTGGGSGAGLCRPDILRRVRALPAFRQRVFALAKRLLDEIGDEGVAAIIEAA